MDITLDKKSSTEASIKITLKESDYQPKVEEKVKEYAKKANIKGFRPGKVPTGLIKKMYGKSILVEEVNHLLSHSLMDYIRENKIQILGEPLPDMEKASQIDWDTQKEFEFDYNLGLVDDFEYELSDKQEVKSYKIEVDQKTIDETLDNLKNQFGEITNPEVSEAGDSLYSEFQLPDNENTNSALLPIDKVEEKEQKMFIGLKKGDTVTFDIKKTIKDEALLNQLFGQATGDISSLEGEVTLTVQNVNRTIPAEINQEFFDKVFGPDAVKDEEEFIEKVKSTIASNYQRESEFLLEKDIKDLFIENTKIDIPDNFLKDWLIKSNEGKVTEADLDREYDSYVKELKWDLIKNRISEDNEINVENPEVVEKAKEMIVSQLGGPGIAEQLKDQLDGFADNYLKGENGENYMKVFNQVRSEKIFKYIKDQISINEEAVDIEQFKEIVMKQ